ncbi:MAG: M36 family metallopeptidase, partial [Clostridia bacterium]|nr:M36 family metallopeptidase [Clostridia bacterium]
DFAVVEGINITEVEKSICNTNNKAYITYTANVSGYNSSSEYIAYDVFVDGLNGEGVCVSVTSSFENETEVTENDISDSYIYKMATASDKFNWNDDTMELSKEPINIADVTSGNSSAYVASVKNSVDSAYNYFNNAFGYKGIAGNGESFMVYINSNEYVEEDLPTERAMYTNGKLMFFKEDLTQGDIDYNTVMHEYAHGVMHNIVGFSGTMEFSENSAIAEGLADVFAELAEATATGALPDWVHGERILFEPTDGYLTTIPVNIAINSVSDCYSYSTIVSHLASQIYNCAPSVSVQNELWFKTMCFMTKNTDFSELSSILNVVALNMYEEYKLTDLQYQQITECIKMLDTSSQNTLIE